MLNDRIVEVEINWKISLVLDDQRLVRLETSVLIMSIKVNCSIKKLPSASYYEQCR